MRIVAVKHSPSSGPGGSRGLFWPPPVPVVASPAMRTRLVQRQPGLVARLRVDMGATAALEPSTAALERRTLRVGVALALALAALQSIAHLIDVVFFDLRVDMINADSDSGAFAWASSVATFCAALLLCLLAVMRPTRTWPLVALAGAVAFMSLDDMVGLHERVSGLGTTLGPIEHFARIFWPLVFMPLLAATFVGLLGVAAGLRVAPGRALLAGLALLVVAIALEMASPILFALGSDHGELAYELEVVLEEGAELAGWILVSTGLAAALLTSAPEASRGEAHHARQQGRSRVHGNS